MGCQGNAETECLLSVRKAEVKISSFGSAAVLVCLCACREVATALAHSTRHKAQGLEEGGELRAAASSHDGTQVGYFATTEADWGSGRCSVIT